MPWFYVDDGFSDSKPVMNIPERYRLAACGLWVLSGSWAAKEETDGKVPEAKLIQLGATPAIVDALCNSPSALWQQADTSLAITRRKLGNISFKNWQKWQKTRAELDEKRRADAERQRTSRARKAKGRNAVNSTDDGMSQCDAEDSANRSADADDGMSQCDVTCESHVTSRARAQTRPDPTLSSYLGGECPVGEPDGLPPRFCEEHPQGTNRGCGNCREARLRREAAEKALTRDEDDAKRRQRDAAANCPDCEGTHWLTDAAGNPTGRCTHGLEPRHA